MSAVAGDAQASVSWTVPSNGGSGFTSYIITNCDIGGNPLSPLQTTTVTDASILTAATGTTVSATVTSLINGTDYTFKVVVTNVAVSSLLSLASPSIRPRTIIINSGNITPTDIFILKYLEDGTPQWAKSIGGTNTDETINMISDSQGNIYVSGYYNSLILNIPGFSPNTLTNSGGNDTFILKYSSAGTPQWAKNIGGNGSDQPVNMLLDSTGNLYISGTYSSTSLTN